jgi:ketol-acid reductoisomerase
VTRTLHESDADRALLDGATVGVIGFGNQGAAQARCLRDDGVAVVVFLPASSPSQAVAAAEGFAIGAPSDLARCDVAAVLAPDASHSTILNELVAPHAKPGTLLVFAHGFALREGARPRADLDVALVGPLGPGELLRARYLAGAGLAGLLAVVHDATGSAFPRALAYASRLGMTRAVLFETTLEEEVVSDLFAEQAVLVGGAVELLRAAWETLVEDGISEEIAYYSCVQELKQMMDVVAADGIAGMREKISSTAHYGGLTRGPRIVGDEARRALRGILSDVRSGRFATEWRREQETGTPRLRDLAAKEAAHPMEGAGRRVRESLGQPR